MKNFLAGVSLAFLVAAMAAGCATAPPVSPEVSALGERMFVVRGREHTRVVEQEEEIEKLKSLIGDMQSRGMCS